MLIGCLVFRVSLLDDRKHRFWKLIGLWKQVRRVQELVLLRDDHSSRCYCLVQETIVHWFAPAAVYASIGFCTRPEVGRNNEPKKCVKNLSKYSNFSCLQPTRCEKKMVLQTTSRIRIFVRGWRSSCSVRPKRWASWTLPALPKNECDRHSINHLQIFGPKLNQSSH